MSGICVERGVMKRNVIPRLEQAHSQQQKLPRRGKKRNQKDYLPALEPEGIYIELKLVM